MGPALATEVASPRYAAAAPGRYCGRGNPPRNAGGTGHFSGQLWDHRSHIRKNISAAMLHVSEVLPFVTVH